VLAEPQTFGLSITRSFSSADATVWLIPAPRPSFIALSTTSSPKPRATSDSAC
jgi:hypothetical protein